MRFLTGVALFSLALQAACGGSSDSTGTTTPTCTVTSVGVSANPAAITTAQTATLTGTLNASTACAGGFNWTLSPAATGNQLNSSAPFVTATFLTTTPGSYTITATSLDDRTKSASTVITVTLAAPPCGTANGTTVTHTSNINASETWAGDGVTHVVTNDITVGSNAVVTIQPCAIVSLGNTTNINVGGSAHFVAAGTSASRYVYFKRNVATQAWGSIRGVSATALIDLTWATLEGGGNFGGANPTISGLGNGYATLPAGVIRVDNVTILGSKGVGVYLDANAGFTSDSQLLTITGSGDRPINTTMMSLGTVPTGTYTGNATDEVLIFGPNANIFANTTIQDLGVPIRIPTGAMVIASTGVPASTVTLTLKPGVIFKFPKLPGNQPGARVTFGTNGNSPNNLVGVLSAIGTAAKPIVFTSGETTPAAGDWVGIWLNTANGSRLDFVEINYAGGASSVVSANCRLVNSPDNAALLVGDLETQYVPPSNLITNSKITNSAGYGIDAMWQAGIFNSVDLTATNTFTNNQRCKQTYNGLTPGSGSCPVGGGCTAP